MFGDHNKIHSRTLSSILRQKFKEKQKLWMLKEQPQNLRLRVERFTKACLLQEGAR